MKLVHEKDRHFISYLMSMAPNEGHGMWIAGGTPLSWYRGEPTNSDIDLFFEDEKTYRQMLSALEKHRSEMDSALSDFTSWISGATLRPKSTKGYGVSMSKLIETRNAVTFEAHSSSRDEETVRRYHVQLIRRRWYPMVTDLLDDFDITVCQIATNLDAVHTGRHFAEDVANRRLRLHNVTPSTTKRLIKYWVYGYQPDDQLLESLLADDTQVMEASQDDY